MDNMAIKTVILGIILGLSCHSFAVEVDLLNPTYDSEGLEWTTYSANGAGWRETQISDELGNLYPIYVTCKVDEDNVDSWLRLPYIERGHANRLFIDMTFTIRQCTKHPDQTELQQCKEAFKLLHYPADSDFANENRPTWDDSAYEQIDVIAADKLFVDQGQAVVNYETRSVALSSNGVYFAFRDEGACLTLMSVRIYYKMCPAKTINFAYFPNTPTGSGATSVEQAKGTCVEHAAMERDPSYLCQADGTWSFMSGGCRCTPGYHPNGTTTSCIACPIGTYKWKTDNAGCEACPAHSRAPHEASVECRCDPGYYRNLQDDKSMPCTQPPSPPRNLTVAVVEQTLVNLTWLQPSDLGGRRDITYHVECRGNTCDSAIMFHPRKSGFNSTSVLIKGLKPSESYTFVVSALNGVSDQSGAKSEAEVQVTTTMERGSTQVTNFRIEAVGDDYIVLTWNPPFDFTIKMASYQVNYYPENESTNPFQFITKHTNATVRALKPDIDYLFSVRGEIENEGYGEYSPAIKYKLGQPVPTPHPEFWPGGNPNQRDAANDHSIGIIAGSAVAVVVCMIIVIIMVIIFLKRNSRACNDKNMSDCDTLQYTNVHCPPVVDGMQVFNGMTVPLFQPPGGVKTYVDPHTYEDPHQAVREFTREIDASLITIESVIGGGEFGDVCKGKLQLPKSGEEKTVAIKTLKVGTSDKNRLDFLTEASIMGQFDDPNVIYLEGVVTKSHPIMIVTEFMENGSLDTFLRNNDGKFTILQLVGMLHDIAVGMKYLSEMGYVHRDLAARNILVNKQLVCKVADFGLSREIESDDTDGAYTTKGGKIPVRWTAPEAIAYRKFTSSSDIWGFGVVMWEVMSYGERPYWNWSNQNVIKAVDKGFRLPPPMGCPEAIHQLMLDTWQQERCHRPKFTDLATTLDKLVQTPELLRKIAKPTPYTFPDANTPDLTCYDNVELWLQSIKMERYIDSFLEAGVISMETVAELTLKDLVSLGVSLVGHQKKINASIQTLRAQLYGMQVSEGFIV